MQKIKFESFQITEHYLESQLIKSISLAEQSHYNQSLSLLFDILSNASNYYQDESHEKMAKFYFVYGTILFKKLEQHSDIFQLELIKNINQNEKEDQHDASKLSLVLANHYQTEQSCFNVEQQNNDIQDLQLVWENLELSKILFMKQTQTNEVLQNLASICIKKAEFEAWRDCYSNSIVEYQKGLEYLLLIEEEKCSRKISSVYFQMANYILLESKENCEEKALEYYNKSKDILRNIIDKDDEKTEKTQISCVIRELEGKIEDTKIQIEEREKMQIYCKQLKEQNNSNANTSATQNVKFLGVYGSLKRENVENKISSIKKLKKEN